MTTPDRSLLDGKSFTVLLREVAPEPATMSIEDRTAALDKLVAALVVVTDLITRELYLELASTTLKIGKKASKDRLAHHLRLYQAQLDAEAERAAEAERIANPPEAIPPLERFQLAIAGAVPGFTFLLAALAPRPALLEDVARLKVADQVIAAVLPMADQELRGLHLDEAAALLDLKPKDLRARFRLAQNAPTTPAGPEVGGEERDSGYHRQLVASLSRYIGGLGLSPDAVCGWRDAEGQPAGVKHRQLVNNFFFTHASYFESLVRDRIDITLSAMIEKRRLARRAEIVAAVTGKSGTAEGQAELRRWLIATTHRDDPVDLAVMMHWMWQVKRLNSKRRVEWDLMPIFVGKQGTGKSWAIELLCKCWAELVVVIKAANLTDERSTELLGDFAIGFWGEMSGGNKADAAALKSALTSLISHYRELGGHNHNSVVRRMAFIGDSNNQVCDVIVDATGARRFYEISVPQRTDHAALKTIDPLLCWQAVGEDDPPPYAAVEADVLERQKALVHQDSFDHFLEWCETRQWQKLTVRVDDLPIDFQHGGAATYTVGAYVVDRGYTLFEIQVLFAHYARFIKTSVRAENWMGRRLTESGWVKRRPRAEGTAKRPFFYFKPLDPVAEPEGLSRGEKAAAPPSPAEDLFAASRQASAPEETVEHVDQPERQPGDDEEEGSWRSESDHHDAGQGPEGGSDDIPP